MKIFKKVLLTNDDGYGSDGLKILTEVLKRFSHQLYIVAPLRNMSGSSRSITLNKNINFKKKSSFEWVVDGTPSDAMIFALNKIFDNDLPNYIFSGINSGSNIGDEIHYSGTVGAAYEGAIRGIPSVALSQATTNIKSVNFEISNLNLPKVLMKIKDYFSSNFLLLNVNFPCCTPTDVKEILLTKCCNQKMSDNLFINEEKKYFKIGVMNKRNIKLVKTDQYAISQNHISFTPLVSNLTNNFLIDNEKN